MKRLFSWLMLLLLILVLIPSNSFAQVATIGNKIAWDEVGQVPSSISTATYNFYVDASTTPVKSVDAACVASTTNPTTDSTCTSSFPSLTPGTHTIVMTQVISTAESDKSLPLQFTFVVVVTPKGLRLILK